MGFWRNLIGFMFAADEYDGVPDRFTSVPSSITETYDLMQIEITRIHPAKAMEWRQHISKTPSESGTWLDQNFPIPGGWGHHLIIDGPRILRDCYPSHGPVDPNHCP